MKSEIRNWQQYIVFIDNQRAIFEFTNDSLKKEDIFSV